MTSPKTNDSLKTVVEDSLKTIFEQTADLNINEVEFSLKRFWQRRPAFGIVIFDRLSRILKGQNYPMTGPNYQLVIYRAGGRAQDGGGRRVILEGQETIQQYCQAKEWQLSGGLRRDGPIKFENKQRVSTTQADQLEKEYQVRLRMSQERSLYKAEEFNWARDQTTEKVFRYRKRYSFQVPIDGSDPKKSGTVGFDLSIYKEGHGTTFNNAVWPQKLRDDQKAKEFLFMTGPETYDIELEYRPAGNKITEKDLDLIAQLTLKPLELSLQTRQMSPVVIPKSEQEQVYNSYRRLTGLGPKSLSWIGARVFPMGLQHLISGVQFAAEHVQIDDYVFTLKADGTRNFLYLDKQGMAYLIDMNHQVRSLNLGPFEELKESLLDVEVIDDRPDNEPFSQNYYRILAFDILFFKNEDVRKLPLFPTDKKVDYRFQKLDEVIKTLKKQKSSIQLETKTYYRTPLLSNGGKPAKVYKLEDLSGLVKLRQSKATLDFPTDGLILTHISRSYPIMGTVVSPPESSGPIEDPDRDFSFKVKNLNQLSVDFLYRSGDKVRTEMVGPMVGETNQFSLWVGPKQRAKKGSARLPPSRFMPVHRALVGYNSAYVSVVKQSEGIHEARDYEKAPIINTVMRTEEDKFQILDNFVYESTYSPKTNSWVPIRHRPVKTFQEKPNAFNTANSTWDMILNILRNPGIISEITEDNLIRLSASYLEALVPKETPTDKGLRLGRKKKEKKEKITTFEKYLLNPEILSKPPNYYNSKLDSIWETQAEDNPNIKTMNTLHNQVKGLLYQTTASVLNKQGRRDLRLLELASGKGADFIRWKAAGFTKVVGVEIDPVQINEATERYQVQRNIYFSARRKAKQEGKLKQLEDSGVLARRFIEVEYIQGDMTLDLNSGQAGSQPEDQKLLRQVLGSDPRFDVVACQFAIHFAMSDLATFRQFMRNISQNLKSGGYFIGTSFIASRIKSERDDKEIGPGVYDRLSKLKSNILKYETEIQTIWSIQKGENFGDELTDFGQDIWAYLLSLHRRPNREFLVNLLAERVIKVASDHNLRMVRLPNSLIGADNSPQAFGEIYRDLQANKIKPVEMKKIDIMAELEKLLKNERMAEFSRFNSLFVFQKVTPEMEKTLRR